MLLRVAKLTLLLVLLCIVSAGKSHAAEPSVAFFYAPNAPVDELKAFDIVVVEPDSGISPSSYGRGQSELFAYVSLGETSPNRGYAKGLGKGWVIGKNSAWGSMVMDSSNPDWRRFFLDRVIAPLWEAGYRGFFFDTMDSYQLAVKPDRFPAMEAGITTIIRDIGKRFPGARLILNRGFEVIDGLRSEVFAVAAESLFSGYSPARGYHEVAADDRAWLMGRLNHVRSMGIPVISIDYAPPGMRKQARETAEKIRSLGFIPWVTDKELSSLGVGSVEVVPRKIVGLYDGSEGSDPVYTNIHRFAVMPLNYMGYTVELHDMRKPLPAMILEGRYAGVVAWPNSDRSAAAGFTDWFSRAVREGVKVVFLENFGVSPDALPAEAGIEVPSMAPGKPPIRVLEKDAMMGFEAPPLPQADSFQPVRLKLGKPLLRVMDSEGKISEPAGITPWGGYVLSPFVLAPEVMERTAWVVDPFSFFREALRLPDIPAPDTTTENGARLLLSHVDGDGFESRAEWPGGAYAGEELRRRVLEKYRIPATISVISGIIAPNGLYPRRSAELEDLAREIYRLPWVEAASHTFSHPFRWNEMEGEDSAEGASLRIPGYTFSLDAEIGGSLDYINSRLLPKGKKAAVFLWSGDCTPGAAAIAATYRQGVGNMNGGLTLITGSYRSLTAVAPLGVDKGGWFQVFAPNQNENVYTDLWQGRYHGYQRVMETFRMTDSPRRLKPVNIYYHFYSATKEASLKALDKVYSWAVSARLNAVFSSEYIDKVIDFNRTVVARKGDGWLIRNSGSMRQLRIPATLGYPDMGGGLNVAGYNDLLGERYVHLGPGGEAELRLTVDSGKEPYISRVNGALKKLSRDGRGMEFTLAGRTSMELSLANAGNCSLFRGNETITPLSALSGSLTYRLPEGKHELRIQCR
jgi:hypothetical protein